MSNWPLTLQQEVEKAILHLVREFIEAPYRFFTEADAVARFHQLLSENVVLNERAITKDGFETGLIHREYPTFFRFADKDPTERLGPPAKRGHYDTVILNPEFVKAHSIETVTNRTISAPRDTKIIPLQAIIEFKLDNKGWSSGRTTGTINEFGKLSLSFRESPLCYLVVLMRYNAPNTRRWEKYWPQIKLEMVKKTQIGSMFAVNWIRSAKKSDVYQSDNWILKWSENERS